MEHFLSLAHTFPRDFAENSAFITSFLGFTDTPPVDAAELANDYPVYLVGDELVRLVARHSGQPVQKPRDE